MRITCHFLILLKLYQQLTLYFLYTAYYKKIYLITYLQRTSINNTKINFQKLIRRRIRELEDELGGTEFRPNLIYTTNGLRTLQRYRTKPTELSYNELEKKWTNKQINHRWYMSSRGLIWEMYCSSHRSIGSAIEAFISHLLLLVAVEAVWVSWTSSTLVVLIEESPVVQYLAPINLLENEKIDKCKKNKPIFFFQV